MSGAVAEVPAGPGERLLIVNGDDFGLTPGVSRGIVDAYRHGVLRSTSMLAVGPAFELAAALATSGDADGLGIGAHLALVGEDPPLLSAREVPTLVDRRGGFTSSWREFLPRAAAGRIDPADVERELDAQLERLASVGVPLTHVDSHQHLHLWPPVGRIVLRLARRRDIRALRVTRSRDAGPVGAAVRRLARWGPPCDGWPGGSTRPRRRPAWPIRTTSPAWTRPGGWPGPPCSRRSGGSTDRAGAAPRSAATRVGPTTPSAAATAGATPGPTSWLRCATPRWPGPSPAPASAWAPLPT